MKNTFGQSVALTVFGESHGSAVGAVLDGLAPGIEVNEDYIQKKMRLRQARGDISTGRHEADEVKILSGVLNGRTTGTPICFVVKNGNVKSEDYDAIKNLARPGHADYTAQCKYHGFQDKRGGGHFSGRVTAGITAAGALTQYALEKKGIVIASHILRCAGINDRAFCPEAPDLKDMEYLNDAVFPVLDSDAAEKMQQAVREARQAGNSVGGILETAVTGFPAGVGEPWFDSLEGVLSHALFSVPGVKGVSFGSGFETADMNGFEANDSFRIENGKIITETNHNGGINGGISNGMPIIINTAVKPTPSIAMTQNSVDIEKKTDAEISVKGRHDPAIVHRARSVVDAVAALTLCDMLALRFGTDWLRADRN